tara:strand:+ start:104 stop:283 length:180 start_codon:yes stop_codon:yes gene_type:complete
MQTKQIQELVNIIDREVRNLQLELSVKSKDHEYYQYYKDRLAHCENEKRKLWQMATEKG